MRIAILVLALIFGSCAGFAGYGLEDMRFHLRPPTNLPTRPTPYPHFAPKFEGGVSLRFAMVHDVIHERYPVRGPAYYRERDRLAREKLKTIPPDSQEAFDLADDLGVGLDKLGRAGEAVPPLRDKLARQEKVGYTGRNLYTSYANLGTFLIHANMKAAMAGNAQAKANVKEGLEFIRKSIDVNPEAHFGREEWQQKIGKYLLAAIDDPSMIAKFDCVGNDFTKGLKKGDFKVKPSAIDLDSLGSLGGDKIADLFDEQGNLLKPPLREAIRWGIRTVGAEPRFPQAILSQSVPFDEPVLGIVGMWRQGGGANPYFAVALGEITLRVGQRYIAWTAYERAHQLADKYGWKPEHATVLREQCRRRQELIERELPADEVAKLRPRFEAELEHGRRFQHEYHEYEAAKIAAGAAIHDDHFFDDFYKGREPIATPLGAAEWFDGTDPTRVGAIRAQSAFSTGILWAGIAMFAVALIGRFSEWMIERNRPRSKPAVNEVPPLLE